MKSADTPVPPSLRRPMYGCFCKYDAELYESRFVLDVHVFVPALGLHDAFRPSIKGYFHIRSVSVTLTAQISVFQFASCIRASVFLAIFDSSSASFLREGTSIVTFSFG